MVDAHTLPDIQLPTILGFDMPSSATGDMSGAQVMVAMLSCTPDHHWMTAFAEEAGGFRGEYGLADLRVNRQSLVLMAPMPTLRRLTRELRAFVHQVSRRSVASRVFGSPAAAGTAAGTTAIQTEPRVRDDLERVAAVPGIPAILEAVTRQTGMRFAAVARVTDSRWTACAVYDAIEFGLLPGQDLVLETTICNEIRQHRQTVAFGRATGDPVFATHPTPAMYGFESYISVPIYRPDGAFFGTLCAIDPEPARLDTATIQAIEMFARAIGAELDDAPIAA